MKRAGGGFARLIWHRAGEIVHGPLRSGRPTYDEVASQIARIADAHRSELPDGRPGYPRRWIVRVPTAVVDEYPESWGDRAAATVARRAEQRLGVESRDRSRLDVTLVPDSRIVRGFVVSRPDVRHDAQMSTVVWWPEASDSDDAPHLTLDDGRRVFLGLVGEELVLGRGVVGRGRVEGDPTMSRCHAAVTLLDGGLARVKRLGSGRTVVDGHELALGAACSIRHGSCVILGRTALRLQLPGGIAEQVTSRGLGHDLTSQATALAEAWKHLHGQDLSRLAEAVGVPPVAATVLERVARSVERGADVPGSAIESALGIAETLRSAVAVARATPMQDQEGD